MNSETPDWIADASQKSKQAYCDLLQTCDPDSVEDTQANVEYRNVCGQLWAEHGDDLINKIEQQAAALTESLAENESVRKTWSEEIKIRDDMLTASQAECERLKAVVDVWQSTFPIMEVRQGAAFACVKLDHEPIWFG